LSSEKERKKTSATLRLQQQLLVNRECESFIIIIAAHAAVVGVYDFFGGFGLEVKLRYWSL
jgi:hypothetical protein